MRMTADGRTGRALGAARGWIEAAGRVGYVAKALVYGLVGALALQAAAGAGGATAGKQEVLTRLVDKPFGEALLAGIAFGLFGYAVWRLLAAIFDPENAGHDAKGLARRVGWFISAIIHGSLGVSALRIMAGSPGQGDEAATRESAGTLLSQPFGPVLLGIVGAGVIVAAAMQLSTAWKASFVKKMKRDEMSAAELRWARTLGQLGHAARGVVFAVMAIFLLSAALHAKANEAKGLGGALESVAGQPYGPLLLGIVATGLLAYAAYALFASRYQRIVIA